MAKFDLKCLKCKICKQGCDNSQVSCKNKCAKCMNNSKVAGVKEIADKMAEGPAKDYILKRLVPQMVYYGTESVKSKRKYLRFTVASLIATGVIPILSIYAKENPCLNAIIACLSSIVTFIGSYLLIHNSKNTWILYRLTREKLFNTFYEQYAMVNNVDELNEAEKRKQLIEKCEKTMSSQMDEWYGLVNDAE